MHSDEVRRKLQELQQNYLENLPQDIRAAEAFMETLRENPADTEVLAELYRLMHRLNGSGMTFGFPDVSAIASTAERDIQALMDQEACPEEEHVTHVETTIQALKVRVAELTHSPHSEEETVPVGTEEKDETRTIALVSHDAEIDDELVRQILYFGYTVYTVATLPELNTIPQDPPLTALILDMELPDELPEDWQAVSDIQSRYKKPLPLIFLSTQGELTARLRAIRAGGNAYFVKPVDASNLVDTLDRPSYRLC